MDETLNANIIVSGRSEARLSVGSENYLTAMAELVATLDRR